jgi:BlaI family transcriptional regulator, penicillinase repressor
MSGSRSNRLTGLGELQLQVLDILTKRGTATVYDILDEFPEKKRPRYTTVLTVLRTLEHKGLASHDTRDRSHHFSPTERATAVRGTLLAEVLNKVFNGSPRDLVATLLDTDAVTPEVLQDLKKLIAESEADSEGS